MHWPRRGWSPSVAARDANHLDLFITGYDGHVYTTWWHSSLPDWGSITLKAWKDLGGTFPLPTETPKWTFSLGTISALPSGKPTSTRTFRRAIG
jgi:hypothetical protein